MLAMLARNARDGKTIPESLDGKLVVRVAMGMDVLVWLQQQLQQVIVGLRCQVAPRKGEPKEQA